MQIIALIRHGDYHQRSDTPSALQPYPLTDMGVAQARECGSELARLLTVNRWALHHTAYSSLQLRAWQTAQFATQVLGETGRSVEIQETPDLSERMLGSAANLTVQEIEKILQDDPRFDAPPKGWKSDREYQLPLQGAESLQMAGARVAGWLRQLVTKNITSEPTLTLVFGHGAAFRHAAHDLGVLQMSEISQISMYHARPLLLCYKSNGMWAHYGGTWKPRARQDTALD